MLLQIQKKNSNKTGGAAALKDPPPPLTHPHRPGGSSVLTLGVSSTDSITTKR